MSWAVCRRSAAVTCGVLVALSSVSPAAADATRDRQWHLAALEVAKAHQVSRGSGVVVGVIDTGVKADHPDLVGNVLPGVDLTGEDTKGQRDTNGHGTGMAGLIAAHGHGPGGADGALGIAPEAKILPIRDGRDEVGSSTNLPTSIRRAVAGGAKVLSMSLTTGTFADLRQAVREALDSDVVVVAGVGNRPGDAFIGFPAAIPGVVAVGASGRDGKLSPVTVTGAAMVITAPGVDMASTSHTGGYQLGTGTSDATAIVAGAAALVRSKYPQLSATEVVRRLTATAFDRGAPGRDPEYGFGVLNLVGALTADLRPPASGAEATAAVDSAASPSAQAGGTSNGSTGPLIRLSPALYIAGVVLLGVLVAIGVVAWRALRSPSRSRRRSADESPSGPTYLSSGIRENARSGNKLDRSNE